MKRPTALTTYGPDWKRPPPPSPPPVITQQPLNQHVHRLLEWSQNWTERLMLKWDSFPVRTAQLDKGWTQTEMSPADVGGVAGRSDSVCFGGPWVLCLDSELLGSSFPVLPHPCQTLHSTVKQSRADSYPPELAFLQLVFANHSSEGERPPRPAFLCFNAFKYRNLLVYIDLCGGRPTETHQGSSRVGCWLDSSLRCTVSKYQY